MDAKEKPYKFVVRLPTELRNQIADAAKYYRRSMNSEIVARLEQSFSGIPTATDVQELAPDMYHELESFFGRTALTTDEEKIIRAFRRLTEEKRNALLELLN